jgi:hypothetical protein
MCHTPALDVARRPLRPTAVTPCGKVHGISWATACLIRSGHRRTRDGAR